MIFVDYIDRAETTATMPTVCMHCKEPTCALVCPADPIKVSDDGVVMSALKPRCLDCRNCVNACPFGVPKYNTQMHLQMKCDMCYFPSLLVIPRYFIYLALAGWLVVSLGFIYLLLSRKI